MSDIGPADIAPAQHTYGIHSLTHQQIRGGANRQGFEVNLCGCMVMMMVMMAVMVMVVVMMVMMVMGVDDGDNDGS